MSRADEFIQFYNQISDFLREMTGSDKGAHFADLISRAARKNAAVRTEALRLRDYADLRNVIVHHHAYPAEIIAEPSVEALADFQRIVEAVTAPPLIYPMFQKHVDVFSPEQGLEAALTYMRDHDYSQIVVATNGRLTLLTAEGIAGWLVLRASNNPVSLSDAQVQDALTCQNCEGLAIMSRNQTIFDAHEAFAGSVKEKVPRLYAIVITENGRATEHPLGLVTPWDLLEEDGNNGGSSRQIPGTEI